MGVKSIALWTVRVSVALSLVLGLVIWMAQADSMILIHILLGVILSVAMIVLAVIGFRAKQVGFAILVLAWALVLPVLGLTQGALSESMAMGVQVLHLILGVGAWVVSELLARRLNSAR